MTTVQKAVDVRVPVRTAYDQWTQFEEFPKFMGGVERVEQLTPTRLHWKTKIAGVAREFDAEITEQHPDERVAWQSLDGPRQGGQVSFESPAPGTTRVVLRMDFEPEGLAEKAGDATGMIERQVARDLDRFKQFIEARGYETGAWRGEVPPHPPG